MPVCLLLAGAVVATLPTDVFALTWTHSVEKTEWTEEWRVETDRLVLIEASVAGSGAGMEPADDARLEGGMWRWRFSVPSQPPLLLANSPHGGDYQLCWDGSCQPLAALLPERTNGPVEVTPCRTVSRSGGSDDEEGRR